METQNQPLLQLALAPKLNRILAFILDYFFTAFGIGLIFGVSVVVNEFLLKNSDEVSGSLFFGLVLLFFVALIFRDAISGQSLGKRCLGIQVVDINTRQPSDASQSFMRNILFLFNPIIFIEWVILLAEADGRLLGDKWAKTVVVEKMPV